MLSALFVLLCLIAPVAIAWWLLRVQRRVRALPRRSSAAQVPEVAAYTDQMRGADGLAYGRAFDVNDELLAATRRSDEPSDVKNLQGQR
ncbi:MAG: hypothetical protein QOG13_3288 [Sphingomonadales bacterium]|jgi:hypothetical protein|nr:hypothetical protein [Sphingomonadales bacterium]MEA3045642.1 hypothetical protein [Sphingomonadales bacterium]